MNLCSACLVPLCLGFFCFATGDPREADFNFDWKFNLQEQEAHAVDLDDTAWREVRLPHDWSVEAPFNKDLEGCTGYLPGGVGWYRKHFAVDLKDDQVAYLCFDGIYNRADVWLNGSKLGFQPYGYSPFFHDITSHLRGSGEENILAIKVDHSRYADSRWYSGSGIYRNVKLITANRLHVPIWGTFVTTPDVSRDSATVDVEIKVKNAFADAQDFELVTRLVDPAGNVVASVEKNCGVPGKQEDSFLQQLRVDDPKLWDIDTPQRYTAMTTIVVDGKVVDEYQTAFGIRTIRFDRDQGFFLNGKNRLIKGVCLHHDGGLVGAAVPAGVWKRRLAILKAGGCNALRTAHNPSSQEFLDLCDEMGFLVQVEFYDEWDNPKDKRKNMNEQSVDRITRGHAEYFQKWAERDLKATMLRDRNHPSVFQWSIGNEIEWTYVRYKPASGYFDPDASGNYFWTPPHIGPEEIKKRYEASDAGQYVLADTARKLSRWTKEMDTTRPVTSNCILPSVSHVTGYTDVLDVVGYSYRRVVYDYAHRHFPDETIMGTENLGQWHEWKAVIERPFVSGVFFWTGIDYMGEANDGWPKKGTGSGLLDSAGFEKPAYHMMKTLWCDEPHVHLSTQALEKSPYRIDESTGEVIEKKPDAWKQRTWAWHPVDNHWNYGPSEMTVAEVYANSDRVELFLNDRSLGIKSLSDFPDRIYKWAVPFQAGTLTAQAKTGTTVVRDQLQTAGDLAAMTLTADKRRLAPDGYDVAHLVVQLTDENGVPVRTTEQQVTFEIEGPVRLLGVDNGSLRSVQQYQSHTVLTDQGRCLLIVQSGRKPGTATVRARAGEIQSAPVVLEIR